MKQCKKCNEYKPRTTQYFYKSKTNKDGFYGDCKQCRQAYYKQRKAQKKMKKQCRTCGESKPSTSEFFYKHKNNKDGLLNECKVCKNERAKERHWELKFSGQEPAPEDPAEWLIWAKRRAADYIKKKRALEAQKINKRKQHETTVPI